ncbi:MAG: hypothetical protein ACR2KL_01480 [Nocardioidaceae bacterium]
MNDLMPPPRRPLSSHDRQRIRALLQDQVSDERSMHRSTLPLLVAATVATIAVGGYAVASALDGGGAGSGGIAPADGATPSTASTTVTPAPPPPTPVRPSVTRPGVPRPSVVRPTPVRPRSPRPKPTYAPPGTAPPTRPVAPTRPRQLVAPPVAPQTVSSPAEAYQQCFAQVRGRAGGGEPTGHLRGRVLASAPDATTVVVSDGVHAWACNVAPDRAVSRPVADAAPQSVDASTFAFALNAASNYGAGRGDLAWAGGVLPPGATALTFTFPDGHVEPAVVSDGYWVVQYLSTTSWSGNLNTTGPVLVEIADGTGGSSTVRVPLGAQTVCNQVSHGC